jgi:hypothetical protein
MPTIVDPIAAKDYVKKGEENEVLKMDVIFSCNRCQHVTTNTKLF